ncbi:MAG: FAD-dependent oxidoreductase [Bacteroidota bacterium]
MEVDVLIIGGGLFGCYAALYLAGQGQSVVLVEKETELLRKASIVNQARLHGGYHYPRSVATALMSDENKARFTREHRDFILFDFEKYYAIDRFGSFTDARQFERFCAYIDLKCERVARHPHFNTNRLEAVFKTTEYTFDPILLARYYRQRVLADKRVRVLLRHEVKTAETEAEQWRVSLHDHRKDHTFSLRAAQVINATYSGSNAINRLFGVNDIRLMHEISEMAFVTSPQLGNTGLTVMDGPFASIMPYGKSGLLSLSSVAYTHHKVSYEPLPAFDCQTAAVSCRPDYTSICNGCPARPASNYAKMLAQIRQYLQAGVQLFYATSMFTIKSKLRANYIDDGRPTEIARLSDAPPFYCVFAGKINSIYEIEKVIN